MTESSFPEYWAGLVAGELRVPRCRRCGSHNWPPRVACPQCLATVHDWVRAPDVGSVFTWTVVGRSTLPDFIERVPYLVGVISLPAFGIRVIGHIVDDPATIRVELAVRWQVIGPLDGPPRVVWTSA